MTTTTPNDELTPEEGADPPLLSEQIFALELLADPRSVERWVRVTDQADIPARVLQWAKFVADGTPRTQAPYWYEASPAWTRWLDSRDAGASVVVDDAPPARALAGPQEDDLRGRIARLEFALRESTSLLAEVVSVLPVNPGKYARLQRQAQALALAVDLDG